MHGVTVEALIRYPVKGLTGQKIDHVDVEPHHCFAHDRAFAIENGPAGFNEKDPKHFDKVNFLTLMRHERLALLDTEFDEETNNLTIKRQGRQLARGDLGTSIGRNMIEQFIAAFMSEELKGPPRILHAEDHHFTDTQEPLIHIINLQSVEALSKLVNLELTPERFRANIHLTGLEPWAERSWLDKSILIGEVEIKPVAETSRCAAVNVDLETAKRGKSLPATLAQHFGDNTFGIYGEIVKGGHLSVGDHAEIISS